MTWLFAAIGFVGAMLVFTVQPMVGRFVLPELGGSPQVWTTSMLFFQAALLGGYSYAHFLTRRGPRVRQPVVHLVVAALAALSLPVSVAAVPTLGGQLGVTFGLLSALVIGVGPSFVVISATGPLVQRWFSLSGAPRASDPYFLFVASNLGSAAGLVLYPVALEPYLSLELQALWWSWLYALTVLALFVAGRASFARGTSQAGEAAMAGGILAPQEERPRPPKGGTKIPDRVLWVALAFVPSSLMLSATTRITTDVAAVPLLWIVPLGTYLLTFAIAFLPGSERVVGFARILTPPLLVVALLLPPLRLGVMTGVLLNVAVIAVVGTSLHGMLSRRRPEVSSLTLFYLLISVGGALGGVFNAIVGPLFLSVEAEYLVGAVAALLLLASKQQSWKGTGTGQIALVGAASAMLVLVMAVAIDDPELLGWLTIPVLVVSAAGLATELGRNVLVAPMLFGAFLLFSQTSDETVLERERTFFGTHAVVEDSGIRRLMHGTTVHGVELVEPIGSRSDPAGYYHPESPFGDIMRLYGHRDSVGVLGLGTGGIAAYGRPGQEIIFYELDPTVVRLAADWFSFVPTSEADISFVIGDGRASIVERVEPHELIILDAFTSDAVPVHLLTEEAFAAYLDTLTTDGVVVVHTTNRYLDLDRVVAGAANQLELAAVRRGGGGAPRGTYFAQWVVLARHASILEPLEREGWERLDAEPVLWTDQRSSLWSARLR